MQRHDQFDRIMEAANKANEYARSFIVKGTSRLESNSLSKKKIDALKTVMGIVRDDMDTRTSDPFLLVPNIVYYYENAVSLPKKYSVGNCFELALQALDYFLERHKDIRAELFRIEGGDHTFVVLGRLYNSDPSDPLKWGEDAVICDPWAFSDEDRVYKASDYLSHLKNHFFQNVEGQKVSHYTENFDPNKHTLNPREYLNSDYLADKLDPGALRQAGLMQLKNLLFTIKNFRDNISDLIKHLLTVYDSDNKKIEILSLKISELNDVIHDIEKNQDIFANSGMENNYNDMFNNIHDSIQSLYSRSVQAMTFTPKSQNILFTPQDEKIQTKFKIMMFGTPDIRSEIEAFNETANKYLQKIKPKSKQ